MIYLYLKTHNKTGLKYLGKTEQDPFIYKGSGYLWKRHLSKYGNDVTTEILLETDNKEEIKKVGIYYSDLWNVVESNDFANIVPEQGDGGDTSDSEKYQRSIANRDISGTKNGMFGRSAITEGNLKWYHNGTNTIYVTEGTEPEGYVRGRLLGKRGPHSEETKKLIGKSNTGKQSKSAITVISPTGEVFRSIQMAADSMGITMSAFRYRYEDKHGWKFIAPK
jgi:hypothetical protein